MDAILLQFLNGLDKGSAYALIALGLTLIFGTLGVVNFAHGALFMLGAFCAVAVNQLLAIEHVAHRSDPDDALGHAGRDQDALPRLLARRSRPRRWSAGRSCISLLITIPFMLVVGVALERGLIRHFYKRPHAEQILVTFGLAIVLQELIKAVVRRQPDPAADPAAMAGAADVGALPRLRPGRHRLSLVALRLFRLLDAGDRRRLRLPAVHHLRHGGARRHGRPRDGGPARHRHRPALHDRLRARRRRRRHGGHDVHAHPAAELPSGHGLPGAQLRRRRRRRHGQPAGRRRRRASCSASCRASPR